MYRTHTHLLLIGALLAFLCAPLGRASAQDWSGILGEVLSEIPMNGLDFDVFDDYPSFRPRGRFYDNDDYYWSNNRDRYSPGRQSYVRTPSNIVSVPLVEPPTNQMFSVTSYGMTSQEIAETQRRVRDENKVAIKTLASFVPNDDALASEIQTSSIGKSMRAQIFAAARAGDSTLLLKRLLDPTTGGTHDEQDSFLEQT